MNEVDEEFECPECESSVNEGDKICHKCKYELTWEYEDEEKEVEEDTEFEGILKKFESYLKRIDRAFRVWQHKRIIINIKTYERFMTIEKDWTDAYMLYCHYFYTARKKKTNAPWANRAYCVKGLKWSSNRVDKAKKILIDEGLIEIKDKRNSKGYKEKTYIVMKYLPKAKIFEDFTSRLKNKKTGLNP